MEVQVLSWAFAVLEVGCGRGKGWGWTDEVSWQGESEFSPRETAGECEGTAYFKLGARFRVVQEWTRASLFQLANYCDSHILGAVEAFSLQIDPSCQFANADACTRAQVWPTHIKSGLTLWVGTKIKVLAV